MANSTHQKTRYISFSVVLLCTHKRLYYKFSACDKSVSLLLSVSCLTLFLVLKMAWGILAFPAVVINDCQITHCIVLCNPHAQNINSRCIYMHVHALVDVTCTQCTCTRTCICIYMYVHVCTCTCDAKSVQNRKCRCCQS